MSTNNTKSLWSAVLGMALCAMMLVASEFIRLN